MTSGGELQGIPKARRVICESREATLWSLNGSSGDGWGAEGHRLPATCGHAASGTPLGIAFSWDTLFVMRPWVRDIPNRLGFGMFGKDTHCVPNV